MGTVSAAQPVGAAAGDRALPAAVGEHQDGRTGAGHHRRQTVGAEHADEREGRRHGRLARYSWCSRSSVAAEQQLRLAPERGDEQGGPPGVGGRVRVRHRRRGSSPRATDGLDAVGRHERTTADAGVDRQPSAARNLPPSR